jgi:hypothetical protein
MYHFNINGSWAGIFFLVQNIYTLSMRFVLYSIFVQLYLQKYSIFVLFLDKIKYPNCPISQFEYDP